MNYIKELNGFYKFNEARPLTANVHALYNYLLHKCNTLAWPKSFTLTNTMIMATLQMPKTTLHRVRKVLLDNDIIKYTNGYREQCGTYTLIPFEQEEKQEATENARNRHGTNAKPRAKPHSAPQTGTLYKQNKKNSVTDELSLRDNSLNTNAVPIVSEEVKEQPRKELREILAGTYVWPE